MSTKAWLFKFRGPEDTDWVRTVDGAPVCELHHLRDDADGYLIAAAPAMRDALEVAVKELERIRNDPRGPEHWDMTNVSADAISGARAALAKAAGTRAAGVLGKTPRPKMRRFSPKDYEP